MRHSYSQTIIKSPNIFILLLLCISCNKAPLIYDRNNNSDLHNPDTSHLLTATLAEGLLMSFLNETYPVTKGMTTNQRTIRNYYLRGNLFECRSNLQESDVPVYVFNFTDNQGFALVGGDSRLPGVLCVIDQGELSPERSMDGEGTEIVLANIETYCRMCMGLPIIGPDGAIYSEEEYGVLLPPKKETETRALPPAYYRLLETYGSILECNWGQWFPFNYSCFSPNGAQAKAGCVPIAVGQIMFHHGINFTYGSRYFDWDIMHEIKDSSCEFTTENDYAVPMVADFVRLLGNTELLNASYSPTSTTAKKDSIPSCFEKIGYHSGGVFQPFSYPALLENLNNGPAIAFGFDHYTTDYPGNNPHYYSSHTWVIDQVLMFAPTKDLLLPLLTYSHCNWGRNGTNNGYFLNTTFNSNDPQQIPISRSDYFGIDGFYQYNVEIDCTISPFQNQP